MSQTNNPIPQGKYVPATRFGQLVYTAGMTPRKQGVLIQTGQVRPDAPLSDYREAVRQAAANALAAARNMAQEGEAVTAILSIHVYINAPAGFTAHTALADFASEYFCEELGQAGVGSRAALGMSSLPGDAPVEIAIVAALERR